MEPYLHIDRKQLKNKSDISKVPHPDQKQDFVRKLKLKDHKPVKHDQRIKKVKSSSLVTPMLMKHHTSLSETKEKPNTKKIKEENEFNPIGDVKEKFPILKNKKLIEKFMKVKITNNQKGRIRQQVKDSIKGTEKTILPYIIHNMIERILQEDNLSEAQLRKIRILYNMLTESLKIEVEPASTVTSTARPAEGATLPAKKHKMDRENKQKPNKVTAMGDGAVHSIKRQPATPKNAKEQVSKAGPKRYIVFVGNLPRDVTTDAIKNHFSLLKNFITSIRIPHPRETALNCHAYVEFVSKPSFEMALSKHHTMLGNRRINVLYTTSKESKITKAEAKAKRAKLVAMVKAGKMPGSIPLAKKRSQRRLKQKKAAQLAEARGLPRSDRFKSRVVK